MTNKTVVNSIASLNAIINPCVVVLVGLSIPELYLEELSTKKWTWSYRCLELKELGHEHCHVVGCDSALEALIHFIKYTLDELDKDSDDIDDDNDDEALALAKNAGE